MANAADMLTALDGDREFLAACIEVQQPFEDAKNAYREALTSGDLAAIKKAQTAKNNAALQLREFRRWARLAAAEQEAAADEIRVKPAKATGRVTQAGDR